MSKNQKETQENNCYFNTHLNHLFDIEDDEVFLYQKSYFEQIQKKLISTNNNNLSNKRGENV